VPNYYNKDKAKPTYTPTKIGGSGGSLSGPSQSPAGDAGKLSVDLTDPVGSIGESIGSAVDFGSGLVGGVAGAIGSIGLGDGANLGAIGDVPGNALGALGGVPLPYLGDDPNQTNATVGDIPGKALDLVSLPGQAAERTIAGQRVTGGPLRDFDPRQLLPGGSAQVALERMAGAEDKQALPPDLQARLDAGESVDVIADELVARGAGYSNDPVANLAGQIIMDPLNLIAPGASKAAQGVRAAGIAVRAGADLGLSTRFMGVAYNAASRGMSAGGSRLVDAVLGPTTSGVLHALGTKPYRSLRSSLDGIAPAYRRAFEDAFALGAAQMPRAVIGHYLADEASALVRRFGTAAMDRLPGDVGETVARRLDVARAIGRDDLERRTQELLSRVAPTFDGVAPDVLATATARKLAAITGMSAEDAAAVIGPAVDRRTAQTVHLAFYGRAGDELARAKAAIVKSDDIDVQRLTLVADDTLTVERADEVLAASDAALTEAVERFPILANYFAGKAWTPDQVREFVRRLKDQEALITTVRRPTTGKNALPKQLGAWRGRYLDDGYDLGFAPAGGWKVATDADGVPVYADPFVHFTSEADPITMRNPLGRFADSLFRGVTQTTIVGESRQRFVDAVAARGLPISPNQARAIHKAIIDEAADRGVTPRSLVADSEAVRHGSGARERVGAIDAIFRRFLTDDEYATLAGSVDPVFLTLSAFQGNLRTVGVSQFLTGAAKRTPGLGPMATHVAERVYPNVRFALNPLFQLQELTESKILNMLRGVLARPLADDVAKVYGELVELPELRYLADAGYFLNIASGQSVRRFVGQNTPVGRALGRFSNVQAQKNDARIAQVLSEHGDEFKAAVEQINPRAWRTMTEAYGTTDPREVARRYLAERLAIGPAEDADAALAAFDAARTMGTTTADETVWQAFRSTFEQASRRAFKTHYFNPQRGWLERSLNHPYLGIYPLSYMYGKVLPEFARFLIRRPFGLDAPLVGYAAVERVQQAALGALAEDDEFRAWVETNPDALYLMAQLIPGDPTRLGAGAPAWARHISEDASEGRPITAETVGREAIDTAGYAFGAVRGPVTIAEGLADLGDDVFGQLERAAKEWDGLQSVPD
jgi:hypothetical protein